MITTAAVGEDKGRMTQAMDGPGDSAGTVVRGLAPGVAKAAVAGAIAFVVAQKLAGFPMTIPEFMGGQIVSRGGYPESLAPVIGWTVHLGVSLSYAALFAIIVYLTVANADRAVRWAGAAAIAVALGVVSTLVTAPAIAITISVLSGNGLPEVLPALNTGWGFVFWNHLGFFAIAWAIVVAVPDVLRGSR